MDSAARGSDRKVTCPRCFARVPEKELTCPECGAPMRADVSVPVADNALHSPLAEANLLRLRGDLEGAEKKCLSLLRRYPNEPEAHVLLGDLSADRGDWRRAVEWYELAVDLNPNSTTDRTKLEEAKRRIEEADTAETVEQLGLPEHSPRTPWYVGGVLAVLFVVVIIAMATNRSVPHPKPPVINSQFNASPNQTDSTTGDSSTTDSAGQASTGDNQGTGSEDGTQGMPLDDRVLMEEVKARSKEGDKIGYLVQDTRFHTVTLNYTVPADGDARKIGATLAKDTLDQATNADIVTVRGISQGQVVFVADATRENLTKIESSTFQSDNQDNPDAWISALLEKIWTPESKTAPPGGSTESTSTTAEQTTGGETSSNPTTPSTSDTATGSSSPASQPATGGKTSG